VRHRGESHFLVLYYGELPFVPPAVENSEGDWTKAGMFCGPPGRAPTVLAGMMLHSTAEKALPDLSQHPPV
jgi:hypothetical protein